jgi:hypothetical protein
LTLLALYRAVAHPAPRADARRFERFLCCWFAGGLILFCVSPHNQSRLMYPMIPAAALLAGRELDRLAGTWSRRTVGALAGTAVALAFVVFIVQYHRLEAREPGVRETLALARLATTMRSTLGDEIPLTYVDDTPFAFQLLLNTMRPTVSYDEAASLLRRDTPAVVAAAEPARLRRAVGAGVTLHELARATDGTTTYLQVLSNRPALAPGEAAAVGVGSLTVTLSAVRLGPTWHDQLVLYGTRHPGNATVENGSTAPRTVAVRIGTAPGASSTLAPGATWRVDVP